MATGYASDATDAAIQARHTTINSRRFELRFVDGVRRNLCGQANIVAAKYRTLKTDDSAAAMVLGLVGLAALAPGAQALDNGLSLTPAM